MAYIDKSQALHTNALANQTELEQDVQKLRIAQAATVRSTPAVGTPAPGAALPTDPDTSKVFVIELPEVVESCGEPKAGEGEKTFIPLGTFVPCVGPQPPLRNGSWIALCLTLRRTVLMKTVETTSWAKSVGAKGLLLTQCPFQCGTQPPAQESVSRSPNSLSMTR